MRFLLVVKRLAHRALVRDGGGSRAPKSEQAGNDRRQFPGRRSYEFTVVPWIAEGSLRTELLLNSWQYVARRRRKMEVTVVQFGQDGERVKELQVTVGPHERKIVPLDAVGTATYGVCYIEPSGYGGQHIQIYDNRSFAITHGRPGRRVEVGWPSRLIRRALLPYRKSFNAFVRDGYGVCLLVFNRSNESCWLAASRVGRLGRVPLGRIAPFGALKVDLAAPPPSLGPSFLGTISLRGSALFDYYVLACADGAGGRSYSIQHVK